MGLIESFKKAREIVDFAQMPHALEIKDSKKRSEFHNDYKRLVGRCGQAAMLSLVNLYLIEQEIEKNKGAKTFPKIEILGYNNTSEIIARFVENGWAEYYLSEKPVFPTAIAYLEPGNPAIITSYHNPGYIIFKEKLKGGIPNVFAPEVNKFERNKKDATLIFPNQIRNVFAKIDSQFT